MCVFSTRPSIAQIQKVPQEHVRRLPVGTRRPIAEPDQALYPDLTKRREVEHDSQIHRAYLRAPTGA